MHRARDMGKQVGPATLRVMQVTRAVKERTGSEEFTGQCVFSSTLRSVYSLIPGVRVACWNIVSLDK